MEEMVAAAAAEAVVEEFQFPAVKYVPATVELAADPVIAVSDPPRDLRNGRPLRRPTERRTVTITPGKLAG